MRLLIASEARFVHAGGRIWTAGPEEYAFWTSYTGAFDQVGVLARVADRPEPPDGARPADGAGVRFHRLCDYRGPVEYLSHLPRLRRDARDAVDTYDGYLLRAPAAVAYLARDAIGGRRAYGVEVLGDPWESLGPAAGPFHALRPIARRWSRRRLTSLCRGAVAACYVSDTLRRQYPAPQAPVWLCSDVRLDQAVPDAALAARRVQFSEAASGKRPWRLGFLGSLERLYKAPEVHLDALDQCRSAGLQVELHLAGDGRFRPALERRAARLGLNGAVRFLGPLPPGAPVERFLDSLDLFLLASRTEGLPRALVEAMARACPAIGSTAGGIPELLPPADLVAPGRADALAARIAECITNSDRLWIMARRNLSVARQYLWERLAPRRREFLCHLRSCSI